MGHTSFVNSEAGARVPDEESAARLKAALEEAGLIFTAGPPKGKPIEMWFQMLCGRTPLDRTVKV